MDRKFGVMLMLGLMPRLQQFRRSFTDNDTPQGPLRSCRGASISVGRPRAREAQTCHTGMGLTSHCQDLARRNELFEMDVCGR
jgi:hypothetical protein